MFNFSADSRYDIMARETVQNYRVVLGSEFSRQPPGSLENSDSKNSDPLGVSKTQTRKTQTLRKLDNFERFLQP